MEYIKDEYTPDQYSETPVLRNEDIVATYTNRLTAANAYDGSVQEARDLYKSSMSVTPPEESNGIPSDDGNAPITTPDIQLGEQEQPLMARLFNSAPEPLQRMLTPFLVPFTNNKALKGVTIGIGDGINGALGMLRDINNAVVESNGGVGISQEDWLKLPEIIERGDSTTEAIVGGLTQFMSIYGALGKVSSVNKMSSRGKKLFDDMWRGGLADAAFDPEEGNLATLINMLDEDKTVLGLPIGQMNGAFTQWLGTPVGEDAEAFERLEQRAKNLMEGAGLGMLAHGLVAAIKGMKKVMVEYDPDKFFAMLKKAGFDVDPRSFLFENTLGAENIQTPKLNELGMYSQLEKAMLNLTQDTNKPDDLLRYLTKNGVTNDELNNSGVMDLINEKKKTGESITKAEVGEIFDEMDVTQSFASTTRTYQDGTNNLDSMTDEEDLLAVYEKDNGINMDNAHMFDDEDIAGFNGRVLNYDEVDENLVGHSNDIVASWKDNSQGTDDELLGSSDIMDLEVALKKNDPKKYGPMLPMDIIRKLQNINNDDVFASDVEAAAMKIAKDNYNQAPTFQWDLNEGEFNYRVTGNEDYGYTTEVFRKADGGQVDELELATSSTEALMRITRHEEEFGGVSSQASDATKWHKYNGEWMIVNVDAVDTYKEIIITADSPSGTIFDGGNVHFPEDNKAFHLRTTEPNSETLYIEELQSDWAEDISKKGVQKGNTFTNPLRDELEAARIERDAVLEVSNWKLRYTDGSSENIVPKIDRLPESPQDATNTWSMMSKEDRKPIADAINNVKRLEGEIRNDENAIPQSPLPNDKWINVGLRRAIAVAIENGQTRVEWTPAKVHYERWGSGKETKKFPLGTRRAKFEKLYDEKMNGIAKRIANKYKSTSGSHYIEINDAMIAQHYSGKGDKLMAAAPAIPAAQVANDKEDNS